MASKTKPALTCVSVAPLEVPPDSTNQSISGFDLVADMMRRQDDVIAELDELNARIEAAIESLSESRKAELAALESECDTRERSHDSETHVDHKKAA